MGSTIIYIGDNLPIIKLYNKGEDVCKRSTNADLFKKLFHHIKTRRIKLTTFWIPSHLDNPQAKTKKGLPKKRPVWVQNYHIKGNKEADRMAERAAEIAKLPELILEPFKDLVNKLKLIQNRLATIITHLPNRKRNKQVHVPKPVSISKESAIARSKHCITVVQNTVQCTKCLSQCSMNSSCFWEFINSACNPARKPSYFNNIAIEGSVRVGNIVSHSTHKMYSYRGIKYCGACGFMAGAVMRALKNECKGVKGRSTHGQRVLDAIASGLLPPNVSEWPGE